MKRFFIVKNDSKPGAHHLAKRIEEYIAIRGGSICRDSVPDAACECILVFGGDGTFLRAARDYSDCDLPFLGINMGSLGFLTQTSADEAFDSVDRLMRNEFTISERTKLCCRSGENCEATALNDVVIARGGYSHLVGITVFVNDQLFSAYEGDGIIISTATGSTGYNLSAGGPILAPGVNAILITPICPHAFGVRSFVISGDDRVRVKIKGTRHRESEQAYVTVDGEDYSILGPDDEIIVAKSEMTCKMVMLNRVTFIETLKNKIQN